MPRPSPSAEARAGHDEAAARQLLAQGMEELGLAAADLGQLPGSDPRKAAIAHAVHSMTSVPQAWTAAQLHMKSAANVSQQLRRLRRGDLKLDQKMNRWLSRIDPAPFLLRILGW